jgi:hypothetical protein
MAISRLGSRCWFCGERHLSPDDPPEHVIPAALGAELTTDRVAGVCNRRAGKEIDQPLLADPFIGFNRVFYDTRDRRGGRPPNPARNASLADGSPAVLDTRVMPWRATALPQIRGEGERLTITAGSVEEAEKMISKRSERTGQRYRVLEQRRAKNDHAEVMSTVTLDIHLRIRARQDRPGCAVEGPSRGLAGLPRRETTSGVALGSAPEARRGGDRSNAHRGRRPPRVPL